MISIDIEELKRLYYDEEKSGYEIAEHFQTMPQVIYNRMEKHGLQRRPYAVAQKLRYAETRIKLNINEIVRLYFEEELSLVEVGERVGVSSASITKRLWAAGYKCRKRGGSRHPSKMKGSYILTASDLTEIQRLYCEEERSSEDIAFQYDCCGATIRNHLKRQGIQLRTPIEAQALRRNHEQEKESGQHQTSISRQLKQLQPLSPEEVTPERVQQLRSKDNLTIDAIAEVCSLTNLEVYNILQEAG